MAERPCNWLLHRKAERLTVTAFRQAMDELGIPPHPGGECPAPGCNCRERADEVELRAIEIVEAQLGHPLPPEPPPARIGLCHE